ncbi:type II/IV secretion system ATPase subunit [Nitrosarchaeum sp. AC2]|jgi:flagellar protein FlaI|uniref:type II/IV secretion system ATPase subunit n=1 Tax=Nitrosarchaeum sp. AC2 TaxID=2259673 RepID=UPI0015CD2233|nr:type II/IV secretion system ATPase subunit [Nitrosarchaeum sp. AC2]QLH10712.1 type IV secretory pathway protein [Nitrosarchaeum sp. AC2]
MRLNIFKNKISAVQKIQYDHKNIVKSNENKIEDISQPVKENEKKIPQFMTLSKLDWDNNEIHAGIIKDPTAKGGLRYQVIEPALTERDQKAFDIIKKLLMTELSVSLGDIKSKKDAERRLKNKIAIMIKKYRLKIPPKNIERINYFAVRDFVYLGKIEPLMRDHMIEEISCDGTNIPIYVWHREHESIPTNIIFKNEAELNNFARKMAYVCGKHVSVADPIIDASLPGGSRINLTLGHEITKRGSTFTIRRFRADPITVIDLIKFGTMSVDIAAYMWYLAEKRATMLIAGGTASGKTTALNALATFIRPGQKVVSIEDTQELNLPHENWIPAVSRQSFTDTQIGEINQFDLLRAALRQRPDIIIVGETRGREAYTLFQAMATGHGGFSSIHADSVDATLTRLTSSPMDVPKSLISNSLDLITLQLKIRIGEKSARRIIQVSEINGIDEKTGEIKTHEIFKWNPKEDRHEFMGDSVVFSKIKERDGDTDEKINYELTKRRLALEWMAKKDIRDHKEVSNNIMEYYSDPERYYERKRLEM